MKTKLSVWGTQEETIVGGFYLIGPEDRKSSHTAYVASFDDARLYAAAPDLLQALKGLTEYFAFMVNDPNFHEYTEAIAAIKKAEL